MRTDTVAEHPSYTPDTPPTNNKIRNRLTTIVELPEFNIPASQDEWNKHGSVFHGKMTRCTRRDDIPHIPSNLNILRLSTDFGGPKQAESWDGILKFLDASGYDTEDTRMTGPREADLLFISAEPNRRGDVVHLLDMIAGGFLGLVLRDEVLVSGLGVPGSSPYEPPTYRPLLLGTDFAAHGACLIHGYINTLHDPRARLGKHGGMMLALEQKIQSSGIVGSDSGNASGKTKAFQSLLKRRRHVDGEARWVFAAFKLLRHTRNRFAHMPTLPKTEAGINEAADEIDDLAKEYSRELQAPRKPGTQDQAGVEKRWTTQLTQITTRWIDEYLQAYPVQAGAP